MGFNLSRNSLGNLHGVDQKLYDVIELALEISVIDFGIPEFGGVRTEEEQAVLYVEQLSLCDGVTDFSEHQFGNAFDFFAYVNGSASWQIEHIAKVAAAILQAGSQLQIPLSWSGLWSKQFDFCHIELAKVNRA